MSDKIYKIVKGETVEMVGDELAYFQKLRQDFANAPKPTLFDILIADLRRKRNALLAETDWTQFVDSPLTAEQKYSYAEYRQQLRDATKGLTTVEQINSYQFPVRP